MNKLIHTRKHLSMGKVACPIIKISELKAGGVEQIGRKSRHIKYHHVPPNSIHQALNQGLKGDGLIFEQSEEDD